jgi:hypothetical protein
MASAESTDWHAIRVNHWRSTGAARSRESRLDGERRTGASISSRTAKRAAMYESGVEENHVGW